MRKADDLVIADWSPMAKTEQGLIAGIRSALNATLRGKAAVNEYVLACLLARGHLLVEDLPGLGKTTLTYPLPEAQLDRFAMKFRIDYPEKEMLASAVGAAREPTVEGGPRFGRGELQALQERVGRVSVGPLVRDYLVGLAHATRSHRQVILGLSPRGLLTWQRLAQAHALLQERDFVTPDDVQDMATPVLEVRLGVEPEAMDRVLGEILASVPIPLAH